MANAPAPSKGKKDKKFTLAAVTPAGVASYSYLTKPDTEGQYADGKYKVTVIFDGDTDLSALEAKCREVAEKSWPDVDLDDVKMPFIDGDTTGKEELAGKIKTTIKSKFAPQLVDAKRNPLPKKVKIFSGDLIKVAVTILPYESTETVVENVKGKKVKKTVKVYGITLQLGAVQLIEKRNTGSGGAGASMFEDEDGYEADPSQFEDESEDGENADGEESEDGDGDDF